TLLAQSRQRKFEVSNRRTNTPDHWHGRRLDSTRPFVRSPWGGFSMHERIFPSAAAELSCTCARRGRGVLFAVFVAAAGVAGAQGLPFTEQFDEASLSDAAGTTADWGATQAGQLTLPSANALQNMFSEATPAADMPGEFT